MCDERSQEIGKINNIRGSFMGRETDRHTDRQTFRLSDLKLTESENIIVFHMHRTEENPL